MKKLLSVCNNLETRRLLIGGCHYSISAGFICFWTSIICLAVNTAKRSTWIPTVAASSVVVMFSFHRVLRRQITSQCKYYTISRYFGRYTVQNKINEITIVESVNKIQVRSQSGFKLSRCSLNIDPAVMRVSQLNFWKRLKRAISRYSE